MPEAPRSSFIPKQTSPAMPLGVKRRRTFHVFGFISTVLIAASVFSAVGSYLYKNYSQNQLEEKKAELREQSQKFGNEKFNEVRNFYRQLLAVRYLLDQHVAPSKVFDQLELATMQRVQFMRLEYTYDPGFEVSLEVEGGTEEFKTIALQALQFGEQALFKNAVFSGLGSGSTVSASPGSASAQPEYEIGFTVTGTVSPSLLSYDGVDTLPEAEPIAPESVADIPSDNPQ